VRRISTPEQESPRPVKNGVKSSLGDLQGVDLLRGFEKISSSWRETGSPVKERRESADLNRILEVEENGFSKELKTGEKEHEGVNGTGKESSDNGTAQEEDLPVEDLHVEEMDSQMTDVKMEGVKE
jgi:hypothetical protein